MSNRKQVAYLLPEFASVAMAARRRSRSRVANWHPGRRRAARGVAAIEFFLVLPLMLLLLAFPLYLGRYCYYYSVAHAAAYSSASYLSSIPLSDMTNNFSAPVVVAAAREIAAEMLREPNAGLTPPIIAADCYEYLCGGTSKPAIVRVRIEVSVDDIFFPGITQIGMPIRLSVKLPYLGR